MGAWRACLGGQGLSKDGLALCGGLGAPEALGGEKLTRDRGPPVEGAVSAIWEQPKWAEGKVLLPVALSCAPECSLPESPPPQAALGEGARERAALGAGEWESPVQGDRGVSPNSSRLDFLRAPRHLYTKQKACTLATPFGSHRV